MEQETAALRKLLELLDQIDAIMTDEGGWSEWAESQIRALRAEWTHELGNAEHALWTAMQLPEVPRAE